MGLEGNIENKKEVMNINYSDFRDRIYNFLYNSTFVKGVSIVNTWDLYGRVIIKRTNGKYIYTEFHIEILKDKIVYYLCFDKLGEYAIDIYSSTNPENLAKNILKTFINELRIRKKKITE